MGKQAPLVERASHRQKTLVGFLPQNLVDQWPSPANLRSEKRGTRDTGPAILRLDLGEWQWPWGIQQGLQMSRFSLDLRDVGKATREIFDHRSYAGSITSVICGDR
jgi:hypothetical protein